MEKNVVHLFTKLVTIASPSGSEEKVRQFLIKELKKLKFRWKVDQVGNLFAAKGNEGQPILFCAHMDTVNPGIGIKPLFNNNIISSSGDTILGADNKAFISSLLTALELNKSPRALELLFTVKEETGGGIEFFSFDWIKSKKAIIFDSAKPIGGIILRSPNIINFHIMFKGKAAHSSTPTKGKNALLPALELMNNLQIGELDGKETTINVGLLRGGSGINTIPEKIHLSGEIRSYDEKLFNNHLTYIKNLAKKIADKYSVSSEYTAGGYCPGYYHQKNDSFTQTVIKIYKKLNIKNTFYNYSGISDANILNSKGINTINLTDGVIDPHTTKERISVDSLMKIGKIISAIIYSKW